MNLISKTLIFVLFFSTLGFALDEIVTKQEFQIPHYITVGGKLIHNVRIGYETYGKLNKEKNNAILITHYFSGNSHAAGQYKSTDPLPGYWDQVIGPGKPFDTSKYFIVASDTLVNINPHDPNVITTGPLSIHPKTGKPYGIDFPVVTYSDFVQVQKALIESLGISKLVAVAGPSAGSMQALQWAADFPDQVGRVIAVISPGLSMPALSIGVLNGWTTPILTDPKWKEGRYRKGQEPNVGLAGALKAVIVSAVDFAWAEKNYGNQWADPTKSPTEKVNHQYLIESQLHATSKLRSKYADANSFLYMVRVNQAFNIENKISKKTPPILFISAKTDLLFPPYLVELAVKKIKVAGGSATLVVIDGMGGHLVGLTNIQDASAEISGFLK